MKDIHSVGGRLSRCPSSPPHPPFVPSATPAEINRLLQRQALYQYGDQVDAVIKVTYDSNPRNDVFGTALAVRFVEGEAGRARAGPPKDTAGRLQEIEDLRDRGMISDDEYNELRADVLRDL